MNKSMVAALVIPAVILSFLSTLPVHAQTDTIRFENISSDQGLSQATVNAILQDREGFLWFGTEGGLNKYDGYQFTVYKHDLEDPGSLSNDLVTSLYEDPSGELWIGTTSGLDQYDSKTGMFLHSQPNLAGKDISAITQDPSGTLWVGTQGDGLDALDLTTHAISEYRHHPEDPGSLSNDNVNSIYVSRDGDVWIGTDGGLDQFDRARGSFSDSLQTSADNVSVKAIYEDAQGLLWIGTANGLVEWDRAANRSVLYSHDPNDPESLSDDSVGTIMEDSQGTLWIGTLRGLNQLDKGRNRFIRYTHDPNNPSSLSSDYIRSIFEDRSGVLWIGTSFGGLNKYAPSTQKFALYTYTPGLSSNLSDSNIWSIYKDQSQNLWIGTFFSGLNELDPRSGKVTIYQHDPSNPTTLSDNEIRAILQDRNGVLWIGTEHGGLNRFDSATGTFVHYQHDAADPNSLSSDRVFAIFEDTLGRLWIGTEAGGLDRFDSTSGTFIHYPHNPGDPMSLSDDSVRAITQDHTGALWIGTEQGGLNLWDNQGHPLKIYRHDPADPSSLSNNWVLSILEDQNGTVWIGTVGGGLDRFDRSTQSFTHYTVKNGLADDSIYGMLADADGNLWLSTNKGISKFNPAAGTFRNYDISDGLQGNQFNPGAYFQAQDGQMFFGGTKGFNAFYPNFVQDNPTAPPVVITAFKKYNQTVQTDLPSNEAVQLSYRDNFISFEFAALDYNAPEKNQYAYILEGADKDWVYAGTRRYASYTDLPGGDYLFRVKAANNDGVWSETETVLRIHITPPFWQTWWFIGIVGLTLAGGAIGGYRLRVRDMEASNRELARRVDQQTHELAALNAISGVVNRSLDLTENLNAALDKMLSVMHMDAGLVFRLEAPGAPLEESSLHLLAYRGVPEEYAQMIRSAPLEMSMIGTTTPTTSLIVWKNADLPNEQVRGANQKQGIQAGIGIPLWVKGKLVGALTLCTQQAREFTQEELSLLTGIGQQVSVAVENARLYEQAEQTAATTERSRLGRELHDSVTQLLYSVTLYAQAAAELLDSGETETAAGHLRELRDTAQEALREMRLLIFELRRPALEKSGLVGALQARLDGVETRGGMHAELQVEGTEQLPRPVQEELYNIAQEALNNALKYAHANQVRIQLRFEQAAVEMEVSDDGVGFEPTIERLGGGFGITGMNERAQKIGGQLHLESAPGRGTKVCAHIPLNPAECPAPGRKDG